jgi:hypothetical protein
MRGDLVDRSIIIKLPKVARRITEDLLWKMFAGFHAHVLGGLLDIVVTGLLNRHKIAIPNDDLPRMSDFYLWLAECEPGVKCPPGALLAAYKNKLRSANRDLAEGDDVGAAMLDYVEKWVKKPGPAGAVETSAKNLLILLNADTEGMPKDMRFWPSNPQKLSRCLDLLAPVLLAEGIEVTKLKRTESVSAVTMADYEDWPASGA